MPSTVFSRPSPNSTSYFDEVKNRLAQKQVFTGAKPNTVNGVVPNSANRVTTGGPASQGTVDVLRGRAQTMQSQSARTTDLYRQAAQRRLEQQNQLQQRQQVSQVRTGGSSPRTSGGSAQSQGSPGQYATYNVPSASGARQKTVQTALSLVGTPYAWGGGGYGNRSSRGTGKGTQNVIGVDCSGLVSYALGTIGVRGPRQSDAMLRTMGYRTSIQNLQPGDLVGWNKGGHVAMYIGNGQIVESPNVGKHVRVRKLGAGEAVFGVHLKMAGE